MKKPSERGLEIGYRLSVCRRAYNLSKAQLARLTKVCPASISALERGLIENPPFIPQISQVLDIDAGWLMYGGGNAPPFYDAMDELKKIKCA